MTGPHGGAPLLGAYVAGFSAFVIEKVLADGLPDRLVLLGQLAEQGKLDPALLGEVARTWAQIKAASGQWSTWRSSADRSSEDQPAEILPGLSSEIDTATAAAILQVTDSRVRQLARNGQIGGRQVGRTWLLRRSDVELRRNAA